MIEIHKKNNPDHYYRLSYKEDRIRPIETSFIIQDSSGKAVKITEDNLFYAIEKLFKDRLYCENQNKDV